MSTHELPHMTTEELDAFLADHTAELGLTPADAQCFRIRRRRRSLEMATGTDQGFSPSRHTFQSSQQQQQHSSSTVGPLGGGPFRFVKAVLLGDDADGKHEVANMFYTFGDAPVANPRPDLARRPISSTVVDVQSRTLSVATPVRDATGAMLNTTATWRCELWMPENGAVSRELRTESMNGAHVIIVAFNVRDRKTFDAAAAVWLPDAIRYARGAGSKGNGCEVPIILVGTNAEARAQQQQQQDVMAGGGGGGGGSSSPPTSRGMNVNQQQQIVPATEAISLAQEASCAKYVEVYGGNAFHVRELFVQAVQAAVSARVIAGVPDAFLWKRHRVHCKVNEEYFRAPQAQGYFHAWTGQFVLTNSSGGPGANNANGGTVEAFGTLDGSDPASSETAFAIRGPLDLVRGKLQSMMKLHPDRDPPALRVMTKQRGCFSSHTVNFKLPATTPNPHGYVDVSSKMLHLFGGSRKQLLTQQQQQEQQLLQRKRGRGEGGLGEKDYLLLSQMAAWDGGEDGDGGDSFYKHPTSADANGLLMIDEVIEIRYTLDGTEPDENSPVFIAPIPLDSGASLLRAGATAGNFRHGRGLHDGALTEPMTPWSTRGAAPPSEIRAVAVCAGCFRSETVKIDVPEVLPPPRAIFNPTDGTFRIEGGSTTPGVEFRYTTDGSVPCGHSQLYSRPVLLLKRTGEGAVSQVRVAAFPKLSLPSVAVTVTVSGGAAPHHHHSASAGGGTAGSSSSSRSSTADLPRVAAVSPNDAVIPMNRAAMLARASKRTSSPSSSVLSGNNNQNNHAAGSSHSNHNNDGAAASGGGGNMMIAPGSRSASATPKDRLTKPLARHITSPAAAITAHHHHQQQQIVAHNKASLARSASGANTRHLKDHPPSSNSNVVAFDFPAPIRLFYLTATTPGEGKGPRYFRVLVRDTTALAEQDALIKKGVASAAPGAVVDPMGGFKPVAEGALEDYAGIQTLPLPAESRMLKIANVRCEFGDMPAVPGEGPTNTKFQLLDLKVHGNPWPAEQ